MSEFSRGVVAYVVVPILSIWVFAWIILPLAVFLL